MSDALRPTADSLQRLVRALASEPPVNEDAAQEAWLVALRRGWTGPDIGRWVAGAARRIARSAQRDEARRREREQRAALPEATASALDSVERLERVKKVVAAVGELEEPFRQAVVLRYFESLAPREIARMLGVPVNTVRSRVRRGIEGLRRRIEPRDLLVLAPLSAASGVHPGPSSTRSRLGAGAARTGALAAGGVALLAGGVFLAVSATRESERANPELLARSAPSAEVERHSAAADLRALDVPPAEREAPAAILPRASSAPAATASASPAPAATELRGRFLHADGRPAAGLHLVLRVSTQVTELATDRASVPADLARWREPEATTAEDGRFELSFQPPRGYTFALELVECPERRITLARLASGRSHDLGEVVLERGGVIEGRLLDAEGRALLQAGWILYLSSTSLRRGERCGPGVQEIAAEVPLDALTGRFRFEGLPGGDFELGCMHELDPGGAAAALTLAAGAAAEIDLRYSGPDLARRIRLDFRTSLFPELVPEPRTITLAGAGGSAHPEPLPGSSGLVFDDLLPGEYELVIDDPRFLSYLRSGVAPGTRVEVELAGSAALELSAVERATGERLESFSVTLRPEGARGPAATFQGGRIEGLAAGAYTLVASAAGHGLESLALELAPGETRRLDLAFGPGECAAGRVRFADGAPVAGCTVSLLAAGARGSIEPGARPRRALATLEADAAGAFRFALPGAGAYELLALPPEPLAPASLVFAAGEDESVAGIEIVLAPSR